MDFSSIQAPNDLDKIPMSLCVLNESRCAQVIRWANLLSFRVNCDIEK